MTYRDMQKVIEGLDIPIVYTSKELADKLNEEGIQVVWTPFFPYINSEGETIIGFSMPPINFKEYPPLCSWETGKSEF